MAVILPRLLRQMFGNGPSRQGRSATPSPRPRSRRPPVLERLEARLVLDGGGTGPPGSFPDLAPTLVNAPDAGMIGSNVSVQTRVINLSPTATTPQFSLWYML